MDSGLVRAAANSKFHILVIEQNERNQDKIGNIFVKIQIFENRSCHHQSPPMTMVMKRYYPIGTPGEPWTDAEREQWRATVPKRERSYQEQVLQKLGALKKDEHFNVVQYGALSHDPERYPLFLVTSKNSDWTDSKRPSVLVTGGVHGYETSGVQGALLFLETSAAAYIDRGVNILVAPCVSPWGYEHIQRWQADLLDPNRSFQQDGGTTEESRALQQYLAKELPANHEFTVHLDLHETTDTDATEFMPAKHAEKGLPYEGEVIPDGFYLVGDSELQQLEFQQAIIERVKGVTHIAPPDEKGNIIDEPIVSEGVVLAPAKELGLCCRMTKAPYVTTTEVYPDSSKVTDEICNKAQVAAVEGALDFILKAK